ncbi:MAG TPA: DUF3238 domain-containing protein [Acidimicrobiales bacterium]
MSEMGDEEGNGAPIHTVKFWINAFIHPAWVDGPPGAGLLFDYEYFSGDSRGFSSHIHASSRLHSEVEIAGLDTEHPHITFQWHDCAESHAADSDHNVVETAKAQARAHFGSLTVQNGIVSIHYTGAASMPLLKAAPDIDANGWFSVDPMSGTAYFEGSIDAFPWFEAYAAGNNGAPVTLFQEEPTGDGPEALFGDANRAISANASLL